MAQRVKHLPAMQESQVQSLGREDSLEKEMTTHSSILAWKILWAEETGGLQSVELQSWTSLSSSSSSQQSLFQNFPFLYKDTFKCQDWNNS